MISNYIEKHQFEPFDKVLVRHNMSHSLWTPTLFGFYKNNIAICQGGLAYDYCIPYNDETKHLLGTSKPYEEPKPKVWHVVNIKNGAAYEFTHNEFEHFIKTAVLNNKDIIDFNARYVNN